MSNAEQTAEKKITTKRPTKSQRELSKYKRLESEHDASYKKTIEEARAARLIIHNIAVSKSFKTDIGNLKSYEYLFFRATLNNLINDLCDIRDKLTSIENQVKGIS